MRHFLCFSSVVSLSKLCYCGLIIDEILPPILFFYGVVVAVFTGGGVVSEVVGG